MSATTRRIVRFVLPVIVSGCLAAITPWSPAGRAATPSPADHRAEKAILRRMGWRRLRVHDPSAIMRQGRLYWIFFTGWGIQSAYSTNLVRWHAGPSVFRHPPAWTRKVVPGFRGFFWAPDIIHLHGLYLLYYAVSTWGSRISAIGLATNKTLNPHSPRFHWNDQGLVFHTTDADNYNAIDPAVSLDYSGRLWMSFGSFSSGIKLIALNSLTGKPFSPHPRILPLAWHRTIEASYIYRHGGYYYLFVNWGYCCRGIHSTYNIRVGRSRHIQGPYLDKAGRNMLHGGGTLLLGSTGPFIGPGQTGIFRNKGRLFLTCHFYDALRNGRPRLAILPLRFNHGWPHIEPRPTTAVHH